MRTARTVVLMMLAVACGNAAGAVDQSCRDDDPLYPKDALYDTAIPDPATFLRHKLGDEPVHPYKVVEYLERLAELSDRITVKTIGYSHERRPILLLTITSPENHARLEQLRQEHLALADPGRASEVTEDMPVFTWLNYGIHGAESSGLDSVLPTVYHLAASDTPAVKRILEKSVILVNPVSNPDGHAQRVAWLDAYGSNLNRANPDHLEHKYSGVYTRTNHYGFDLNRQWLFATQPEAQAWAGAWQHWLPNLTLDYHEMSSRRTYYFHPGIETRTNPLVPEEAERLMAETVKRSEAFFDSKRLLFFHGAGYDNFFIGKGSTYPLVNGGVGVLYEAGMSRGRFLQTKNGCRNYRDNIRKHFRTALASLESAVELRAEYLRYQKSFYSSALDEAERHPVKAYVVSSTQDPALLRRFFDLLSFHRIEAAFLAQPIEAGGRTFDPANSLLVPLSQPQFRLIRGIFETPTEFEDSAFYDVSSWTLPPAFGLQYAALDAGDFDDDMIAGKYRHLEEPRLTVDNSAYAYVIDWQRYLAPRALYAVLERGLLAKVATVPFAGTTPDGPMDFAPGSIVIASEDQPLEHAEIAALAARLNALDGISIHSLLSGKSASGNAGVDVGAPAFRPLSLPEILLVSGSGISWYDTGENWHLLDKSMRIPVTLTTKNRLDDIDLRRYTHIVFAGGNYERSRELTGKLREWVERGGTLVGTEQAAKWLQDSLLEDEVIETGGGSKEGDGEFAEQEASDWEEWRLAYRTRKNRAALERVSGAIFEAELDTSHPLGFGYTENIVALHKSHTELLDRMENRYATILQYTSTPLVSGYASAENQEAIARTPALIAERVGDGSVVLFADNPNFRGYWYGTSKLFLNALFFSKAFDDID